MPSEEDEDLHLELELELLADQLLDDDEEDDEYDELLASHHFLPTSVGARVHHVGEGVIDSQMHVSPSFSSKGANVSSKPSNSHSSFSHMQLGSSA